ncbi:electron transfer flavoprotein subunit alpha/FixB family protein [Lapidilactobacillus luobeiensis]|uniref:electron transfer flavoprotein subunit alpha/FixB family protein n=1 Tax=Lapidilactobacillus luobeiensis TaxID=2950371 RepID=UPI0021C47F80|nr:electron transfer flavoprotein subunit alpha/FixB family protein [Lapidilactobacillus luobeiensis]
MTKIPEVWIFAEQQLGQIEPTVFQLLTRAREIAPRFKVVAVLFETPTQHLAATLAEYGPDKILVVQDPRLAQVADAEQATLLAHLVQRDQPNSFLFGATALGRSLAPRLQAKLQTGLTADCLALHFEDELLVQTKPSYGDNIMCEIVCPDKRPQMATVRPNTFAAQKVEPDRSRPELEVVTDLPWPEVAHFQIIAEKKVATPQTGLSQAKRIIALGRGAADAASKTVARSWAQKIDAQIGVTRPLTDGGGFSVKDQIGQSGQTVAPELLFCLGISGAVQFLSGITNAKVIVAVNPDPQAAIFSVADYGFVGEANGFLTALQQVDQRKQAALK